MKKTNEFIKGNIYQDIPTIEGDEFVKPVSFEFVERTKSSCIFKPVSDCETYAKELNGTVLFGIDIEFYELIK